TLMINRRLDMSSMTTSRRNINLRERSTNLHLKARNKMGNLGICNLDNILDRKFVTDVEKESINLDKSAVLLMLLVTIVDAKDIMLGSVKVRKVVETVPTVTLTNKVLNPNIR
ncbi:MAG: hypothetical protein MJA29_04790, partial [Candidatus Omnitrophica bacterium]|nr:hypothetical protein [Candidatus Omnitrophota bacterium]